MAALATVSLALVNLIGPLGVLLFIACSVMLMASQPLFNLGQIIRFSPLLLLPLLAIISTMWSDAPQSTMRSGLELMLTFLAAIIVCQNMRPDRFVLALFAAFSITALSVLPAIPAALISRYPLEAWWGSKNQVGFTGYMMFVLALGVIFDGRQRWQARAIAIAGSGYALLIAFLAQSGGSTSTIAMALLVFPPLSMLALVKLPVRIVLVIFALLLLVIAAFFRSDIEAAIANFRTNVLNKDATLTGRTYLWDVAGRVIADRPVLGHGYFAFWRQGNIDAEGLWRWGGIAARGGFNWHNALVSMQVDLGLVGLIVLLGTAAVITTVALVRQVVAPNAATACLIVIMLVNYIRSYVEEGLIAPFSFITMVWLATLLFAFPRRTGVLGEQSGVRSDLPAAAAVAPVRRERWLSTGQSRRRGAARGRFA